jgi:spore photoproduct lyase
VAREYRFSQQDLQQLTEMSIDLSMWGDAIPPATWVQAAQKNTGMNARQYKKNLLKGFREQWESLKSKGPVYQREGKLGIKPPKRNLTVLESDHTVLGWCPVASPKTVCCNLRTLDAVQGCGMGCSYCSIQTFYDDRKVGVDGNLAEKLAKLQLDASRRYHIGSGQSSDSLLLGDRQGILTAQLDFARNNPNIVYEFKTKSKNVSALLRADAPKNLFVSWSMNTPAVIHAEEHGTASLDDRLATARKVADHGIKVGFHFHPIVRYDGYLEDYPKLIARLMTEFKPEEIAFISMGTLTWIKPAIKSLRMRGIESGLLQMEMDDAAGKMSYPMPIKKEMFSMAWDAFTPWHEKVFFYFCMEDRELWHAVRGKCYETNEEFEEEMLDALFGKLGLDWGPSS